jgi:uncharacterized protein
MVKFLLLLAVIALVYWILRFYRRSVEKPNRREPPSGAEDMVRCNHCGVYLPRSESVMAQDQFFCSEAHRRLDQTGSR